MSDLEEDADVPPAPGTPYAWPQDGPVAEKEPPPEPAPKEETWRDRPPML